MNAASGAGHTAVVVRLLAAGVGEAQQNNTWPIQMAAQAGHTGTVQALLPHSTPSGRQLALYFSASKGHSEAVRVLIPETSAKAHEHAFQAAGTWGHSDPVRLLLPMCDAKANGSYALKVAAHGGHAQVVALLLPHSSVMDVLGDLAAEEDWDGIDLLAGPAPLAFLRNLQAKAPAGAMPHAQARVQAADLAHTLAVPPPTPTVSDAREFSDADLRPKERHEPDRPRRRL